MAFFQAKIGRDSLRKREKKKLWFRSVPTRPKLKNSKKIAKKFKKLKNFMMASFQSFYGYCGCFRDVLVIFQGFGIIWIFVVHFSHFGSYKEVLEDVQVYSYWQNKFFLTKKIPQKSLEWLYFQNHQNTSKTAK